MIAVVPNSHGSRRLREFNNCHEPSGSSKGGQFASKQDGSCVDSMGRHLTSRTRAIMNPPGQAPVGQRMLPGEFKRKERSPMSDGTISGGRPLGGGVNETLLLTIQHPDDPDVTVKGVFKPSEGINTGIRDSISNEENFTQPEREVAAYQLDRLIGTNLVPPTVLREVAVLGRDPQTGSLQEFIEDAEFDGPSGLDYRRLYQIVALDFALGNTDRHPGNFTSGPYLAAIDNGLSFPDNSGEWRSFPAMQLFKDAKDEPFIKEAPIEFTEPLASRIDAILGDGSLDRWRAEFPGMSDDEYDHTVARLKSLRDAARDGGTALFDLFRSTAQDSVAMGQFPVVRRTPTGKRWDSDYGTFKTRTSQRPSQQTPPSGKRWSYGQDEFVTRTSQRTPLSQQRPPTGQRFTRGGVVQGPHFTTRTPAGMRRVATTDRKFNIAPHGARTERFMTNTSARPAPAGMRWDPFQRSFVRDESTVRRAIRNRTRNPEGQQKMKFPTSRQPARSETWDARLGLWRAAAVPRPRFP